MSVPNAFVVELIINSISPEATVAHLQHAIEYLLRKTEKHPPDHRFDWSIVDIDIRPLEIVRTPGQ